VSKDHTPKPIQERNQKKKGQPDAENTEKKTEEQARKQKRDTGIPEPAPASEREIDHGTIQSHSREDAKVKKNGLLGTNETKKKVGWVGGKRNKKWDGLVIE